jgi:hypothetical protein
MKSDKLNCLFIHIPKTGGHSVEKTIWEKHEFTEENFWMGFVDRYRNPYQTGGLQHLTGMKLRQLLGRDRFDDFYKFTVVRNPYDRAVSQYKYMGRRKDLRKFIKMKPGDSFLEYLGKIQKRTHVQWEPQVSFLYDYTGKLLVDNVVRFENIQSELSSVLSHLNLNKKLLHENASKDKTPFQSFYCDESKKIIEQIYHDDFEMLDYAQQF